MKKRRGYGRAKATTHATPISAPRVIRLTDGTTRSVLLAHHCVRSGVVTPIVWANSLECNIEMDTYISQLEKILSIRGHEDDLALALFHCQRENACAFWWSMSNISQMTLTACVQGSYFRPCLSRPDPLRAFITEMKIGASIGKLRIGELFQMFLTVTVLPGIALR